MELGIDGLDQATKIGAGTSAVVYRARQIDLDREVAVKILDDTDEGFARKFRQEARALGQLGQHQNVVTVYDTGVTETGQPYLIVELCRSSVLEELKNRRYTPEEACTAAAQVADALDEAHDRGIVHGDIRSGNVLIGQTGRYVVTDFGLTPAAVPTDRTETAGFSAPEATSDGGSGPAADVYALGAMLLHMVTGNAPAMATFSSHPADELTGHNLPDGLADVIRSAMDDLATDRQTAAELRDQLLTYAKDDQSEGLFRERKVAAAAMAAPAPPTIFPDARTITPAPPNPPESPVPALTSGDNWLTAPKQTPPAAVAHDGILESTSSNAGIQLGQPLTVPTRFEERPRKSILLILSAASLLALIGLAAFALFNRSAGQTMTDEQAVNVEAVEGPETSLDATGNEAIGQTDGGAVGSLDPASDRTTTTEDRAATATTGRQPTTVPLVDLPDLVQHGALDAESQLVALGFKVTTIQEESTVAPEGEVIRQTPNGGVAVKAGSTITLVVAKAPPIVDVTIPVDVVGMTEADATAALTAAGLTNVNQSITESSATVAAGTVIGTTPAAGSVVPSNIAVALVVSSGIGEVPDCATIIGLAEAVATAQFVAAGLTVSATQTNHATAAAATVITCNATASEATLVSSIGPIPNLCQQAIGQQVTAVAAALLAAAYSVTTDPVSSPATPVGEVTDCTVNGAAVTLSFVGTIPPLACPSVAGLAEAAAMTAILDVGFTEVNVTTRASESVAAGFVISCSAAGTVAELVVSSGPPATDVVIPNVVGQTEQAASLSLTALGLDVATTEVEDASPTGTVLASNPSAGATVAQGSTVTLQVSSGPALVLVRDVVGRKTARAVSILEAAGFVVVTNTEPAPNPDDVGRVLRTDPVGGTQAPLGSQVVIFSGS